MENQREIFFCLKIHYFSSNLLEINRSSLHLFHSWNLNVVFCNFPTTTEFCKRYTDIKAVFYSPMNPKSIHGLGGKLFFRGSEKCSEIVFMVFINKKKIVHVTFRLSCFRIDHYLHIVNFSIFWKFIF